MNDWTRFSNPMRRFTMPRESYLPAELRGTAPYVPAGTDLAVWEYEASGRIYAIAFQGKADKPLWHHAFRRHVDREKLIEETAASRRAALGRKQESRAAKRAFRHSLRPGDILSLSYGYDQTNVEFYQVVELVGDKQVVVCEIGGRVERSSGSADYVVAAPGECVGKPMKKLVQENNVVKVGDHYAHPWDGKPEYQTASGYGH